MQMNGTENKLKFGRGDQNHWIAELTNDIDALEKIIEKRAIN